MFTGGILQIKLKDVKSKFTMLKLIWRAIEKCLAITKEDREKLEKSICSAEESLCDYLIEFFNYERDEPLKKKSLVSTESSKKKLFLLCLNDVEDIVLNDKDEFKKFLAVL